ncbi:MAG: thiamine ABC transporter substrate-binding protein [Spirochaetaceae bacterium]|nr:thiamine ABC transporter substrate-binding protein [Spirochaetaceae bacterium]
MKKHTLVLFGILVLALSGLSLSCAKREEPALIVYTYDSFVAEWGAGPKIAPLFEKATGIKVEFVAKGDGGQLLSALILEKDAPRADIALGLDDNLAEKALSAGILEPYAAKALEGIPAELRFDPSNRLLPFDFGHFAIIWDSEKLASPPKGLEDLASPAFAKKLILMDPRTSTPGLGFLAWTKAVYGANWKEYWARLRPSVLAMTPGWDTGYGLFTAGEAPLVLSYATSPAYHKEYDKTERYKALSFAEGHVRQIEAAGIVKGARHRKNAEKFLEFLLSAEAQAEIPLTQWMLPANPAAPLPESYSAALRPGSTLAVDRAGLFEDAAAAAQILAGK